MFDYNNALLDNKINNLKCLNRKIEEPHNVDFKYIDGSYKIVEEIYGNKIKRVHLENMLNEYIAQGKPVIQ